MRSYRFLMFSFLVLLMLAPGLMRSQQIASQVPQSDAGALSILQKTIAAAGGTDAIRGVKDFRGNGTITFHWMSKGASGPVEIQGRGLDQVRMDSHVDDGLHSLVLARGSGELREPHITRKMPAVNASKADLFVFPVLSLAEVFNDPTAVISYGEPEDINGRHTYKIYVQRNLPARLQHIEKLKRLKTFEILVDTETLMILGIRHFYLSGGPYEMLREVYFSDYRQVQGLWLPFSISEKAAGQNSWSISLDTLQFNVGLTEETFR